MSRFGWEIFIGTGDLVIYTWYHEGLTCLYVLLKGEEASILHVPDDLDFDELSEELAIIEDWDTDRLQYLQALHVLTQYSLT